MVEAAVVTTTNGDTYDTTADIDDSAPPTPGEDNVDIAGIETGGKQNCLFFLFSQLHIAADREGNKYQHNTRIPNEDLPLVFG
jgi:uncharacterized ParB-like nuclease family protein